MTKSVIGVLNAIMASTDENPAWGLSICAEADLGSGTVYPILTRLTESGWITSWEETDPHPGRPPRRYYRMTEDGAAWAKAALDARRRRIPTRTTEK